jgi:hypothetical protein
MALAAVLAGTAPACAPPVPEPLVRIAAVEPGDGASPDAPVVLRFTGPVARDGIVDGTRVVVVREEDVRAATTAVESEAGAGGAPALAATATLEDDGAVAVLRPAVPFAGGCAHAVVVSSRLLASDGRPVLDPDGRRRTFVHRFTPAEPAGPPPAPVLTETRADAETPEAGGEYVEVLNLGAGPLDLRALRLEKRTASGARTGCTPWPLRGGPVAPGGRALLVGFAWDGRYDVPAEAALYACGGASLLGGLANDRPPDLRLVDAAGSVLSTLGDAAPAPRCPKAVERIDPAGPDAPENFACGEGTPGACNAVETCAW